MSDTDLADTSYREEKKAVRDYEHRMREAKSAKLKHAFHHALGEEKQHARMFSEAVINRARSKL